MILAAKWLLHFLKIIPLNIRERFKNLNQYCFVWETVWGHGALGKKTKGEKVQGKIHKQYIKITHNVKVIYTFR